LTAVAAAHPDRAVLGVAAPSSAPPHQQALVRTSPSCAPTRPRAISATARSHAQRADVAARRVVPAARRLQRNPAARGLERDARLVAHLRGGTLHVALGDAREH